MGPDAGDARIEPIGAPTDPLRPTGRVVVPEQGAPSHPGKDLAWVGVTLAVGGLAGWFLAWSIAGSVLASRGVGRGAAHPILLPASMALAAAYGVGVHVFALRKGRKRVLVGFWGGLGITAAVIIVLSVVLSGGIFAVD